MSDSKDRIFAAVDKLKECEDYFRKTINRHGAIIDVYSALKYHEYVISDRLCRVPELAKIATNDEKERDFIATLYHLSNAVLEPATRDQTIVAAEARLAKFYDIAKSTASPEPVFGQEHFERLRVVYESARDRLSDFLPEEKRTNATKSDLALLEKCFQEPLRDSYSFSPPSQHSQTNYRDLYNDDVYNYAIKALYATMDALKRGGIYNVELAEDYIRRINRILAPPTPARSLASLAFQRTLARQALKAVQAPLAGLLLRHLAPGDTSVRAQVANFLETPLGSALVSEVLALAASRTRVPVVFTRELQTQALTIAADHAADALLAPLRETMANMLRGMPETKELEAC